MAQKDINEEEFLEEEELEEGSEGQEHEFEHDYEDYPSHEDFLNAQKITISDVKEHITGPVISVVVHVILLALLGTIVVFKAPKERTDIEVEMKEMEIKEIEKIPEPPKPPEEVTEEIEVEIDRPDVNTDAVAVDVDNVAVEDVSIDVSIPDLLNVKPNSSALKLPGVYAARATKGGRKSLMKKYGADARNEKTVEKGLEWLAKHQNPDGSWGTFKEAQYQFTALATLAFLARGETPVSQKYGQTIIKAIKKMIEWSKVKRAYIGRWESYSHPIVAYALSEAYGITKMPKIREAMNKTVSVVLNNINKRGSFSYGYDRVPRIYDRDPVTGKLPKGKTPEPPCDLSFAGWNYQTLKSAYSAGCDLPKLEPTIDLAIKGLKHHSRKDKEGGFGIHPGNKPDFGMTNVGILCLGLLGEGNSKEAKKAMRWIETNNKLGIRTCSWRYNKKVHEEYAKAFTHAIFTWYYQTQVIFQATKGRGGVWKRWNNAFSKALIKEQNPDGSWSTPAQKYGAGHLDPKKVNAEWKYVDFYKSNVDLEIYATTLCCLTLEVYYRYLPTYKLSRTKGKKANLIEEDDDLGLKIE